MYKLSEDIIFVSVCHKKVIHVKDVCIFFIDCFKAKCSVFPSVTFVPLFVFEVCVVVVIPDRSLWLDNERWRLVSLTWSLWTSMK